MVTDPIADMLTRIRNANAMRYKEVEIPSSKMKVLLLTIKLKRIIFKMSLFYL